MHRHITTEILEAKDRKSPKYQKKRSWPHRRGAQLRTTAFFLIRKHRAKKWGDACL
jgi:hypothetical protein